MKSIELELPFNKYAMDIHSQNGEDGILSEILNRLKIKARKSLWCVEFGAWDGIYLSNTFALVEQGWNAVYIEGNKERYLDLEMTAKKFSKIKAINAFVARTSDDVNSLDSLLSKTKIPQDFDVLSIDIDSFDCDVWESLECYQPKVVIVEINSYIPPGIVLRHSSKTSGNTFTATLNVGIQKGYKLVCHTGNLFFVRNDLMRVMKVPKRFISYPELLFIDKFLPQ